MAASLHLPVRPKTDLVLLYGMANVLIRNRWIDPPFIEAQRPVRRIRRLRPPVRCERVAGETGLTRQRSAMRPANPRASRVSFWWTMGVNQSHQGVKTAGDHQPGTDDG